MRRSAAVNRAPTTIAGENARASFWAGPDTMETSERRALRAVAQRDSAIQTAAVVTHVSIRQATVARPLATSAAAIATTPTAAIPHPEMAVNVPAQIGRAHV